MKLLKYCFKATILFAYAANQTAPAGLGEVFKALPANMVMNPVKAILEGNYVGILTWAVVFGLALRIGAGKKTKEVLSDISNAVGIFCVSADMETPQCFLRL